MQEAEDIVTRLEQYRNGMWPVHECLRLSDAWTTGVDLDDLPQWRIVVAVLAQEVREAATTIATLRAEVEAWQKLYRRAINEANGLTNYVEDRPELRSAEKRIDTIEKEARAAIDAAKADKEGA